MVEVEVEEEVMELAWIQHKEIWCERGGLATVLSSSSCVLIGTRLTPSPRFLPT